MLKGDIATRFHEDPLTFLDQQFSGAGDVVQTGLNEFCLGNPVDARAVLRNEEGRYLEHSDFFHTRRRLGAAAAAAAICRRANKPKSAQSDRENRKCWFSSVGRACYIRRRSRVQSPQLARSYRLFSLFSANVSPIRRTSPPLHSPADADTVDFPTANTWPCSHCKRPLASS